MTPEIQKLIKYGRWLTVEELLPLPGDTALLINSTKSNDDSVNIFVMPYYIPERLANALEVAVNKLENIRKQQRKGASVTELAIEAGEAIQQIQTIAERK